MATNTELAWRIHDGLKQAGIDIGAASIELIKLLIDDAETERWIPVSEQLPEETTWYLIAMYLKSKPNFKWIDFKIFDKTTERFLIGGGEYFTVTHWRPLPEAPKSEATE